MQDIRLAFRRWRRQPGFAITAIVTLALGLGANIAIFTLVYTLLLRALPVSHPDELYRLGDTNDCCVNSGLPNQGRFSLFSYRLFEALHESLRADFVELAAFHATTQPIGIRRTGGVGISVPAQYVSANYFEMFGVRPAAGRLLQKDDDRPDAPGAVVISHRTWVEHFGQDPSLVGSAVLVSGRPMTVVGVPDASFFGDTVRPNPAGIWIPLGQEPALRAPASLIDRPDQNFLYAIGRLRAGAGPDVAAARGTATLRQWLTAQSFLTGPEREQIPQQHIVVVPAGSGVPILKAQFGQALTILFVTSGLVLLIATANLANLLLARADRGQASIRVALGASTARLIRQSLVEGIVLAALGGIAAIWIAAAGTRALLTLAFPGAIVPVEVMPSIAVWVFAMALAIVTGALFSAGPAWAMSRLAPIDALSGVGRSGSLRSFVPRRSLAVVQVALSFVLISGAGLLSSSLAQLEKQPLGFEPESRTVVQFNPPALAGQRDRLISLYGAIRDRLTVIPGVTEATYALYTPMEGNNWSSGISIAGRPAGDGPPLGSSWNRVGPRYFETVGTNLLRGRLFDDRDMLGGTRAAIVNDAFRRRYFEQGEAIGARFGIGDAKHAADYEIVGIVDDVRYTAPRQPVRPMIFLPAFSTVDYSDSPTMTNVQARSMLARALVIRATAEPGMLEPAVRRALAEVDADLQVIRVLTMTEQVSGNFRIERLMSRLTSLYGGLALIVAAIGLYGVTAFSVAQRTREIGVRMALGADRSRIVRTVMRGPLLQAITGLLIGVPLSIVGARAIAAQLYGVDAADPVIFATAIVVLLASMVAAAIVPGLRAASIDPTRALRGE